MTPHTLCYCEKLPGEQVFVHSDQHVYYYQERAKGGVGLIISESTFPHKTADYHPLLLPHTYDSRCVEPLRKVVDAIHQYGAKFFVQLWHGGTHVKSNDRTMVAALAPSQVSSVEMFSIPKEMDEDDLATIADAFATAAGNIKRAGADGVEVHMTHTSLLEQFMSPFFNKRTDRYGGPLENRMRFPLEVVKRVRETLGNSMALGLRLIADEMLSGGLTGDDMQEIAKRFENTGLIDFLDVDIGTYHTLPLLYGMLEFVPAGFGADYIANIKHAVEKTPVLGCIGKFSDPMLAERLLTEKKMDMVGGARGHITDAEIVTKTMEGRVEDIRPCIACNVFCVDHIYRGLPVNCVLNPVTGREKELGSGTITSAARKKNVLVIGGGCGGMETARVASMRGHMVTLLEKSPELGGVLLAESKYPCRELYVKAIDWYRRQLEKLSVNIEMGVEGSGDVVEKYKPDVVVVATGAHWDKTGASGLIPGPIPGWDQENVRTPDDIFAPDIRIGSNVVILDDESMWTAPGIAELLADQGKKVRIITRWFQVMSQISTNVQSLAIYPRLFSKGIELIPYTYVSKVSGNIVSAYNIFTQEERTFEDVDSVILVTAKRSNSALFYELKKKFDEVYAVGDCVAPRWVGEAVYEGHMLARTL